VEDELDAVHGLAQPVSVADVEPQDLEPVAVCVEQETEVPLGPGPERLSTIRTRSPAESSACARFVPTKPQPPVIRTVPAHFLWGEKWGRVQAPI
jgi:hypothetical protein